jgi:hypothetical protein
MHPRTSSLISLAVAVAALLGATSAAARPDAQKPNAREACRAAVAGSYLKTYDERERLKTYIKALDAQVKDLEAARTKVAGEEKALAAKAGAEAFDVNLAVKRDEALAHLRTLELRAEEARDLKRRAATELDGHVAREARLRAQVERVFVFTRTGDKPDGGYPTELRYKSPCPKYRYLCPLPASDVEALLQITDGGKPLPDCERYASLSKLR